MSRADILGQELKRILPLLVADTSVRQVIVFGSMASGNVHEGSDIDLVVVQDTALSFWERLRAIRRKVQPGVGVDLLVYTPNEFNDLSARRPFVREEIAQKVERPRAVMA